MRVEAYVFFQILMWLLVCGGACIPELTTTIDPAIKAVLGNLATKTNLLIVDAGDGGSDLKEYYATLRSFLPAEASSGIRFGEQGGGFVPAYRPQVDVQPSDRFFQLPNGMSLCVLDESKHLWVSREDSKVELIPPPAVKADIYVHRNQQIAEVVCTERQSGSWLLRCPDLTHPNLWITSETDTDLTGGVLLLDVAEQAITAYSYVWHTGEPRPSLTKQLLTHTQPVQ